MKIVPMRIAHARQRPRRNAFCYGATYFAVPLDAFRNGTGCTLFSIDRFNLFSLRAVDYGDGAPAIWIRERLAEFGLSEADGEVTLLTLPRILGYAFNPVSFYLCRDAEGGLRAVLAEVRNTFGERHSYLCFHDDHRAIAPGDRLSVQKIFHVSPFIEVKGDYRFRFACSGDALAIGIDLYDEGGLLLSTSMAGNARPMRDAALLRLFTAFPLNLFKVMILIHYQAVKLFFKRVKNYRKPLPPALPVSH